MYDLRRRRTHSDKERRTVLRGDKYIPIDERFDILERKVNILMVFMIVDLVVFHAQDWGPALQALARLIGV